MESGEQVTKGFREAIQKTTEAMKGDLGKVRTGVPMWAFSTASVSSAMHRDAAEPGQHPVGSG